MEHLDQNFVSLIQVLNSFETIETIGSCGGHINPKEGQWEKGTWYVKFEIEETPVGWRTIEFLAWAINKEYDDDLTVFFMPKSNPPWLNKPNRTLCWVIEGYNDQNPNDLAEFLGKVKSDFYDYANGTL
ncbi:hypothetical protein E0485_22680 [Paenibacillus albiflavus]|uniref:Uncharacterized protein n=1 Tax=Paenibacillus albiflavus TaxID=2545760 RepID=A0A4R4E1H7_9BACL|nr:hypothetical protein [Paenibacillus albiflavus]TCZ71460.1 hypothetical protein E0485_22680 [Paenibacillus albiflavus]